MFYLLNPVRLPWLIQRAASHIGANDCPVAKCSNRHYENCETPVFEGWAGCLVAHVFAPCWSCVRFPAPSSFTRYARCVVGVYTLRDLSGFVFVLLHNRARRRSQADMWVELITHPFFHFGIGRMSIDVIDDMLGHYCHPICDYFSLIIWSCNYTFRSLRHIWGAHSLYLHVPSPSCYSCWPHPF